MAEAERALIAAKEGDLQTLKSLRRSVPFAADVYGATTLHYASRTGQLACVKWLVEAIGISAFVRGKSGATPLHDAAAQGQLHCVKYLLVSGSVDVDTRDVSGHTALHLAARFGRFETVKWLIEKGDSSVRVKSRNYMTPVHFCASGGHLRCLEFLVFKAGESSVNEPATDGTTPVYLASQDGNLECLKYLHSVGGKCDARARDGMLPVHGAAQNGHLDCIGYLIESDLAKFDERDTSGATPAHYAAAQGHVNVLKWLNLKGDISLTDDLGGSPLHDAAEQGQFECIRFLVEDAGLDMEHRDKEGFTPLALAVKSAHRRCIDYLKIAASKKAKARKRQLIFSKQNSEDGTSVVINTASEKATQNFRASNEYSPKMTDSMNHPFMSDVDRSCPDRSGEVEIQGKRHYSFSFRKENSLEESVNTARPNSSAKTVNDSLNSKKIDVNNNVSSFGNNMGNDHSMRIAGVYSNIGGNNIKWRSNSKLKKQEQMEIVDSVPSYDPTSPIFEETAKFSAHITQLFEASTPDTSETVKALGESRFQSLSHVCSDVIPPPVEFSENSDCSEGEVKGLQPPKRIDRVDEKDGHELPKPDGSHEDNQKRVRFRQTDSLSVIVEIMSFDANVSPRAPEEFQDDKEKVIGSEVSDRQPVEGQRHVTSAYCDQRVDQSESKESEEDLPPWKRQVLLNRKLKEKVIERAEREKREIKERQWIDVPPWKIPLLAKKEKERLKEEQRFVGMPGWKKNLLTRKASGQVYRDYHTAGNFFRASNSMEPQEL